MAPLTEYNAFLVAASKYFVSFAFNLKQKQQVCFALAAEDPALTRLQIDDQ